MKPKLMKLYNVWTVVLAIALLLGLYLNVLYPWMNRWGATDAELTMALPGDGTEPDTIITSTRAITIQAPADVVWKWVVQLGQDRAGFYSNDWLENLVLADIHNSDQIRPDWQHRQIGDKILGAGGRVYQTNQYWPTKTYKDGKMLYLWGSIVVLPVDGQSSRLILRTFAKPTTLATQLSYDWMHFVMERGLLLGVKARAEGTLNADRIWQIIAGVGWIAATICLAKWLFMRRRGWWWGFIPFTYAIAIVAFTSDVWSAMAGFMWWGVIITGFLEFGRSWWKGLSLATGLVVLTFVLSPHPQQTFGLIFLALALGSFVSLLFSRRNERRIARMAVS